MAASRALRPSPRYAALIEARRQRIADLTGAPLGRCAHGWRLVRVAGLEVRWPM